MNLLDDLIFRLRGLLLIWLNRFGEWYDRFWGLDDQGKGKDDADME